MSIHARTLFALAVAAGLVFAPGAAAAYTCFNPAICIAVCGKKTCGGDSKTKRQMKQLSRFSADEMQRELSAAPRQGPVADALNATMSSGDSATAAGYTCFNPAICIAVCGKKTC